ncbi:MAG: hypothetical protein GC156_01965 [Actinomycetales bacterium]|nr:hypothetical protein [Actinomycetales bacterium]
MNPRSRMASVMVIGVTTLTLAGIGAAPAQADDSTPRPSTSGAFQQLRDVLTREEWQAVKAAVRAAHEAAGDEARSGALAPLVAGGTITQAEADAIVAAQRRLGVRELFLSGEIDRQQVRAIRQALRTATHQERQAVLSSALSGLVSDGTITQEQSDAILAAAQDGRLGGGRRHAG